MTNYTVGAPITVVLNAADNASAAIRWYNVTDSGDVEITAARNKFSYTPTTADYDIKVVALGTGYSEGCVSEVTIAASSTPISFEYDSTGRKATVEWSAIPSAATYKVQLSKNNGQTWANYKTDVTTTSITANGLYVGNSYGFRVYGIDANGKTLERFYETTFAPFALTSSVTEYVVGSPVTVALNAAESASATLRWYYVTNSGDVEITAARNKFVYAPASGDYNIRVVATGTGYSEGCVSETTIARPTTPVSFEYDSAAHKATVSWIAIPGAATYKVQVSKNDGATWPNYKTGLTTTSVEVSGLYVGKSYGFRVYGVAADGSLLEDYHEVFYSPKNDSNALLDEIFADFFADELFEEF